MKIKNDDIRLNIAISNNSLKIQFTQTVCLLLWLIRILSFFFFTHMVTRFTKPEKNITYYILQYGTCTNRTNCITLQYTTYQHIIRAITWRDYMKELRKNKNFRYPHGSKYVIACDVISLNSNLIR